MRFTVHRPPCGEVSLCWYRPPGGDVACRVHIGVARPRFAGDARESRLALAVFRRHMPTGEASLRRVRGRDPFDTSRSFVVEPGHQPTPPLAIDRPVKASLLRHSNARLLQRPARGASHRPRVEVLDSNGVEPARQIGGGLFDPVASSVGFAGFEFRDRQLGARSAVGTRPGAGEALLLPAQTNPLTRCKARCMEQFPGGQRCRHRHTAIDTNHAAIARSLDGIGDVHEGDMPATGPITRDAVGLDVLRHGPCPAKSNPADLRHPYPPVTPGELLDMARLDPDLPKPFMHASLAPRWTAMSAGEEVTHGLGEIAQRPLLHRLRPSRQPVIFGAGLGQLRRLLVIPRGATARLPKLLLLHAQIPHEPGMAAMLKQPHLLGWRWQQSEPRHIRKLGAATDNNGNRAAGQVENGAPPRHKCRGFRPKENR